MEGDSLFVPDSVLGWVSRPGAEFRVWSGEYDIRFRIGSTGLRELNLPSVPEEAPCTFLFLGDSFVQGLTVADDDHFASVFTRRVSEDTGRRCRAVLAGIEGYSTDQQLDLLMRELHREAAAGRRVELVSVFPYFNDVYCTSHPGWGECWGGVDGRAAGGVRRSAAPLVDRPPLGRARRGPRLDAPTETSPSAEISGEGPGLPFLRLRRWLNDRSRLYGLVRSSGHRLARPAGGAAGTPRRSVFFAEPAPERLGVYRLGAGPSVEADWVEMSALLAAIRDTARAHGAEVALVHVPLREAVRESEWASGLRYHGWAPAEWGPRVVETKFERLCGELGTPCLLPMDRLARLEEEGRSGYLDLDPHWNDTGHHLIGSWLADWFTSGAAAGVSR